MKKMWKIISLTAVSALLFVSSATVSAEDRKGASGWQVTFDGKKMESNFTSADMSNEVLESLEDAGDAAGGAYDYLLTYTGTSGKTTTLYSSEKFGGEGKIGGVGLHGATRTLQNYFYLDRMKNATSGVVKLKVALDGETLVNDYQNTLARLQMDFATELVSGGGSTTPGNPESLRPDRNAVKTGDETEIMRYIILMFGSGLLLLIGGLLLLSGRQEEEMAETGGER